MKPINAFGVSSAQITTHATGVIKVEGLYLAATANRFLQVHDTVQAPAAGAVPKKQWPLNANAEFYKEFKFGDLVCNLGCWVGISSTDGTYTAAADTMDVSVELNTIDDLEGTTFVGDLTTAVTGLQVWTEAAGTALRKRLVSLEVDGTNLANSQPTYWIMIFATDAPNPGDAPLSGCCIPITQGTVKTLADGFHFGEMREQMKSYDGVNWHYGCNIKISSTPGTYTAVTGPQGTVAIRAEYK